MKLFLRYLSGKIKIVAAFLLFAVIFKVSFALYKIPLDVVLYPFIICAFFGAVIVIVDFLRVRSAHERLCEIKKITSDMIDALPIGSDIITDDCRDIIFCLKKEIAETQSEDFAKYSEMVEYYTVWAHQIKTPISSMKLLLQSEDSAVSRRLSSDLLRIEQYVEMVLTFLRLDSDSSDYVFKECELDSVLRPILKKFASDFIGRKLSLEYEGISEKVLTDEKWISFVIEQVISNSLKYTRAGGIKIYLKQPKTLCIADTGIGIAPEDLPRVFERGYTGYNGRADRSASGIGLYLCRRICRNLGIDITLSSELGVGTTVMINFAKCELHAE